jgi:hypothetical protein
MLCCVRPGVIDQELCKEHQMQHRRSVTSKSLRRAARFFLTVLAITSGICTGAQQPEGGPSDDRTRAILLLQNGDAIGASNLLRAVTKKDQDDLIAWHWLGKALEQQRKPADARNAYDIAARLGEDLLTKQMKTGILPWASAGSKLKPQLELALESTDSLLRLEPSKSKSEEWIQRRDVLATYAGFPQVGGFPMYTGRGMTTNARVLKKPEPASTSEARSNQVVGKVVLRAIFGGDGRVHGIMAIKELPYGLTLKAIEAARKIRFVPATKDGKPVSMWVQLEYYFQLY